MKRDNLWGRGYTQAELDEAEEKFGFRFPPDLVDLWRDRRLLAGYDLVRDEQKIREMLTWPLEGILFDVEQNVLWPAEWGERPATEHERAEVAAKLVEQAPKLIPLYGHRFLPDDPCESGNPVFSVTQSDIIYYGRDLTNYFENEFSDPHKFGLGEPIKYIRFWSEFVEEWGAFAPR